MTSKVDEMLDSMKASMSAIAKDGMDQTLQTALAAAARLADGIAARGGSAADCAAAIRDVAASLADSTAKRRS